MFDLETLTHEQKELLAEDCEDFLLHRNILLCSHSYDNIINQALREGYQLNKFNLSNSPRPPNNYPLFP